MCSGFDTCEGGNQQSVVCGVWKECPGNTFWQSSLSLCSHSIAMIALLLLLCPVVQSRIVYSIDNTYLSSYSSTNITTLRDVTCEQCLCSAWKKNSAAFNCFSDNKTCQFFDPVPRLYRVRSRQRARLYFPRGILPNKSESAMPDLNELISKLDTATRTTVSVAKPRCLVIDNHRYLVTVSKMTAINSTE